jgi:N-acetylglucosaminyl-diphospho-decaprenol L-rhamnosyltransferase
MSGEGGAATNEAALARVTLVTVSYRSAPVLEKLLGSLPAGLSAVVVDNGGGDATPSVAAAHGARLVSLPANEGFGRGCNAGARGVASEFLFFVNPDATLEPGCVERLVAAADALPEASAFNPKVLKASGRQHFKRRSLLVPRHEWIGREPPVETSPVPTLLGSALFCRRDCFEKIGGFDPAIFLYHEDDDLAVRLRAACGPVYVVPSAVVRHESGHSSGRDPETARFKGHHMARSRIYAMGKHGRRLPWLRSFSRALFELALPHNLFSARRRARQVGLVKGAWSMRRGGPAFMMRVENPVYDLRLIKHMPDQAIELPDGWGVYDNSANPDYQLCEVGAFLDYFRTGGEGFRWPDGVTHVGLLSPKIFAKTRLDPDRLTSVLDRHVGDVDAVIFNPYPNAVANRANVWRRGEKKHPGLLELATHAGMDRNELLSRFHGVKYTSYCNYIVANRKFWERYIAYIGPKAAALMDAYRGALIADKYGHHARPLSDIPYFLERCLSEFLLENRADLTFKKINRGKKIYLSKYLVEPWSALNRLLLAPAPARQLRDRSS